MTDNPDMRTYVRYILKGIGDNPSREGLKNTPQRVVSTWKELFSGYDKKNQPIVTTFPNGQDGITYDQLEIDDGTFYSHCEHHMMPFFGNYWFGYIPNPKGKILGLSKIARVVDFYSAKLQIQERLVKEIVDELWRSLVQESLPFGNINKYPAPIGMGLVMKAKHLCKSMRGVKKEGFMTSIELRGAIKENAATRAEFLKFVNGG